jgi:hypothetical protein
MSIPNIRFIRALWEIAVGRGFRYSDQGTFDRTHLRFFTRDGVDRLLRDGGWRPERWGYSKSPRATRIRDLLWRLTRTRSGEYLAYQWFVASELTRKPDDE